MLGFELGLGVSAALFREGFERGIFVDEDAVGVASVVHDAHGTDIDEAADLMTAAGVEDVAGTVDGAGAEGFGGAFHGGADVINGLDAGDGAVDVGGVAEVADDGVQVGEGVAGGERAAEEQAGLMAIGEEADDEFSAEEAGGAGNQDLGGWRGLGALGFEGVFVGIGGEAGGGDPADGIAAFGGLNGNGGVFGEGLVEGANGSIDAGRGLDASGGEAEEGGGGIDEALKAGADAVDDGVQLFGAGVGAVQGAALEKAINVEGATGAMEPHLILDGLHVPTEQDVTGGAVGGDGGSAPLVEGEEGIAARGVVADVERGDGAEEGFDEVEGVDTEVAEGV